MKNSGVISLPSQSNPLSGASIALASLPDPQQEQGFLRILALQQRYLSEKKWQVLRVQDLQMLVQDLKLTVIWWRMSLPQNPH